MQEKIRRCAHMAIAQKKILFGALFGVSVTLIGVFGATLLAQNPAPSMSVSSQEAVMAQVEIATLGEVSPIESVGVGNSWPGELVSLGSVPVQPGREGTISSWNVHIGQQVYAGQVLGILSRSPAMPETVAMVAEKAGDAAMSRVNVEAKRVYVAGRIKELSALRENTEQSLLASQSLLLGGANGADGLSMVAAKGEVVRAVLRSTLAKTYPIFSGRVTPPLTWNAIVLSAPIGEQNATLRERFPNVYAAAKSDVETAGKSPVSSGLAYYDLAIKLADASLPDGVSVTEALLMELKDILHEDQQAFIMAVDEQKKTELMAVDTKKASFEQLRAIDNEIAILKQDLAMAEGDVLAKETAYQTVQSAAGGTSAISAPKSGTVSSIMKNVGEFVGPGIPVAVVTGGSEREYIVRFRMPSTVRTPTIGQEFFVTRSGFPQVMPRAQLIGIGNALDETGSVMADALLLEPVDWPVGVSLRVLLPASSATLDLPLSSVWWGSEGGANVWAVSPAGRVYAQKVTLGRTLGEKVEIYSGLLRGDRYIVKPNSEIAENMLIDDIPSPKVDDDGVVTAPKTGHEGMPGMEM